MTAPSADSPSPPDVILSIAMKKNASVKNSKNRYFFIWSDSRRSLCVCYYTIIEKLVAFPNPIQHMWFSLPAVDIQSGFSNMVSTAYNAALSGLHAASLKLKVGANNLANAHTDGFQKQQVRTQAGTYGIEVKVEKVSAAEALPSSNAGSEKIADERSNVDVAEELIQVKVAQNIFDANAKTLQTEDNMLGRILDIQA